MVGAQNPDVEDLTQEALHGFVTAWPRFRGECSVKHFARRIAVQRCLDGYRRSLTRRRALHALASGTAEEVDAPVVPASRLRDAWRHALTELPLEQAEALSLRYVLGYTIDEVAEETCVSRNTVKSRLRLAKTVLRETIEADPSLGELLEESR
jgi:RNA polymerase sigma-70 factor (ECF subfamily)